MHHFHMPAVEMTKVAERTISDDLEYLISKTVNPEKADYAGEFVANLSAPPAD
jgi:hypothetical protein